MTLGAIEYPRRSLAGFVVGDVRERTFQVDRENLLRFIAASGDVHPLHTNRDYAVSQNYRDVLVHGMCVTARCSAFVAEEFVGSHGLLVAMSADFRLPVFCDDLLRWRAEVSRVDVAADAVEIKWVVLNDRNVVVQRGTACAWLGERG